MDFCFISDNDLEKYTDYINFLKCSSCHNFILDNFHYCTNCDIITCVNCKCQIIDHEIKTPRHLIALLNKLKFNCKYCTENDFSYFDLIKHLQSNHNKNLRYHINNSIQETPDELIKKFNEYYKKTNLKVEKFLNKRKENEDKETKYLQYLENKEIELIKIKNELQIKAKESLESITQLLNNNILTKVGSNLNKEIIQQNEMLLKDIISSNKPNNNDNELYCNLCGSKTNNSLIFYCEQCAYLLCKEKCAKRCKAKKCKNYLCPNDYQICSLCNTNNYCFKCIQLCFSETCLNKFCPDCYKLNQHQSSHKIKSDKCNILPCEICGNEMCIMLSYYCSHCEKRMCVFCNKKHISNI